MAIPVGRHPEYDEIQVQRAIEWIKTNSKIIPIEGSKFNIVHKEGSYALQRAHDGEILGWVLFDPKIKVHGKVVNPLVNIQILPRYRKTIAALMLINGIRQIIDDPVYIDNVVFTGGQEFLNSLAKRPDITNVFAINKNTGDMTRYVPSDLKMDDSNAIILERGPIELSGKSFLPGGYINIVYSFFEEFHSEVL